MKDYKDKSSDFHEKIHYLAKGMGINFIDIQ